MATVILGGTLYEVPELNFIAVERAWPFVTRAMFTADPIEAVSAGVSIIAAGLIEKDGFDPSLFGFTLAELNPNTSPDDQIFDRTVRFLKRKMKATEIGGVRACVVEITREAGLEPASGEENEEVNPDLLSTGTLPPT